MREKMFWTGVGIKEYQTKEYMLIYANTNTSDIIEQTMIQRQREAGLWTVFINIEGF